MVTSRQEILYTTDEYDGFKKLLGNRDVTRGRVEAIKNSIINLGYISNPMIVNENMEIIDGQGRCEALRQLGIPVEYRIVKGIGIKECWAMNLKPTAWSVPDFVKSYAEMGNENYRKLIKLHDEFKLAFSVIYSISKGSTLRGGTSQEVLRQGRLKITDEDYENLREICGYVARFSASQRRIGGRSDLFFCIIGWVSSQPGVDKERLFYAVSTQTHMITPVGKTEVTLKDITECYNKQLSKRNRRYFDYEWKVKGMELNLEAEEE